MEENPTIGGYLISRLYELGVRHVFGIPGDFVLGLYKMIEDSPLELINTIDEQGAGFAADAYARLKGLGAVCITYCVGGLKVANTTAQAYAEQSPVVVISGSPGMKEREKNPLLHHKVKDFDTQKKVFEQLTVASTVIDDPQIAFSEIDRVLQAAMKYKRPVYIEIPRDMVFEKGLSCVRSRREEDKVDPEVLKAAVDEAVSMIKSAMKPVILAGEEIHRFGLQGLLLQLAEKTNIYMATTLLGKSVVSELHPLSLGVYSGGMGREDVSVYVEASDCLIMLGSYMTDVHTGIFTADLDRRTIIHATSERFSIGHHLYEGIDLKTFMEHLLTADLYCNLCARPKPIEPPAPFHPEPGAKITVARVFERLNSFLTDDTVVIADVGDALFGAADLCIHSSTEFLSPAYYTSLGFAVPAAVGVQKANPGSRPLVIVGDGAFQMTGMELTTVLRYGLNPIVVLLNNGGYGTERPMIDGSFNDIVSWRYSKLPEFLGGGYGYAVEREDQFNDALALAKERTDSFNLIEVKIGREDFSACLKRLTAALAEKVRGKRGT